MRKSRATASKEFQKTWCPDHQDLRSKNRNAEKRGEELNQEGHPAVCCVTRERIPGKVDI